MANVARRKQKTADGKAHRSPTYHVQYTDHQGKQHRVAGFTDKRASETLGQRIDELVACRATGTPPGPQLATFIDALPERILKHLRNAGLLDEAQVAGAQPLADHLEGWKEHLHAKGNTAQHVQVHTSRVESLLDAAGFTWWANIDPHKVEAVLAEWRACGRVGTNGRTYNVSVRTSNAYRTALKQFCRWMHRTGRAPSNPLEHLSRQNPAPHVQRVRRALTPAECHRLLKAAVESTATVQGMSGPERALVYRLALETGLRVKELATLQVRHLELDGQPPTVTVEAAYSKGGHTDTLPLRSDLAAKLREHCRDKLPGAPVFGLGEWPRAAEMLRHDLGATGDPERGLEPIPYEDESGRVADFHALRTTFITNLARSGVHPRVAQELARHSTLELTMQVYTRVALETKTEAVAGLPDLTGGLDSATGEV